MDLHCERNIQSIRICYLSIINKHYDILIACKDFQICLVWPITRRKNKLKTPNQKPNHKYHEKKQPTTKKKNPKENNKKRQKANPPQNPQPEMIKTKPYFLFMPSRRGREILFSCSAKSGMPTIAAPSMLFVMRQTQAMIFNWLSFSLNS